MFCVEKITENNRKNQSIEKSINKDLINHAKELLEAILVAEQEEYIDRKKYEHVGKEGKFTVYRNGYRYRNFLSRNSALAKIKVPRCRGGYFKPKIFSQNKLTDNEIENILLELWVEGCSYRDIQRYIMRLYSIKISLGLIKRITDKVLEYISDYHNKPITEKYDAIYADGLYITIKSYPNRSNDERETKKHKNAVVLAVLGQRKQEKKIIREIIDYQIADSESKQSYKKIFKRLKDRGLTEDKISLLVHDGEGSIMAAIEEVYGKEKITDQECLVHRQRNIVSLAERKNREELSSDIWKVYSSETESGFFVNHRTIYNKWKNIEPEAMKLFYDIKLNQLSKYKFSIEVHSMIHSSNPIERKFVEFRRRIRPMGIFETEISAEKFIFLIVEDLNQRIGVLPTTEALLFTH